MGEVFLDAFIDSLKLLAFVVVFTFAIAFFEPLFSKKVHLKGKFAPLIGVSVAMLPQCGFSVVATDLYHKKHITLGTLIAVYLATSDEALPVFLSYPDKALHVLPLLFSKFFLGLIFGYLIDLIYQKGTSSVRHHLAHCEDDYQIALSENKGAQLVEKCTHGAHNDCDCSDCQNSTCPHLHEHCTSLHCALTPSGDGILSSYKRMYDAKRQKSDNLKRFFVKPLCHSIEIFLYVFVVNIAFGLLIYFIGEDKLISFLGANKYIAPLFSVIVGAIPNCVSSVVISKLYIMGGLGFGAALGGLCMNAGVAFVYLFKNIKRIKSNLSVFFLLFIISVFVSYIFSLIFSFAALDI